MDARAAYRRLLRSAEWQEFREAVLALDDSTCASCGASGGSMHVHHRAYKHGRLPWEYAPREVETLCAACHAAEHGIIMPVVGWTLYDGKDLGDLDGECDVCGTHLRYVFSVYHPDWGCLGVGTDCCDRMTGTALASELDRERSRRARFIESPRWKRTRSGNQRCDLNDIRVVVRPCRAGFRVSIGDRKLGAWVHGVRVWPSSEAARGASFDAIIDGSAARLLEREGRR